MKKILFFLTFSLLGGLAVWVWFGREDQGDTAGEVTPVARVEVAPLQEQDIARTLRAFGVITAAPGGEVSVVAPFECVVRAVHAQSGTHVAPGDHLLEIAPSPTAKLEYESARGALHLATETLASTQARYDLQLATAPDLAAARQSEQDARLKLASLTARGLDSDGHLDATVAGTVERLDVSVGAIIPVGAPMLVVIDDRNLEATLGVEASAIADLRPGQPVTLRSASRRDGATVSSHVRQAGTMIDGSTGSADVRVPVPAGAPLLRGEHVVAEIEVLKRHTLVAPRRAVLPDGDHWFLFTVKNQHAVRHDVVPGITAADLVEVSGDGLTAGDLVVTLGDYELTDGMAVQEVAR